MMIRFLSASLSAPFSRLLLTATLLAACSSKSASPAFSAPDAAIGPSFEGGTDNAFQGCAAGTFVAKQSPAAMLIVLDASGTMADANKYAYAQQAIVSAIDQDAFDTMNLGLLIYPTGTVQGPACVAGFPVTCRVPGLAQVPIAPVGVDKSNAQAGLRKAIYTQLSNSEPNKTGSGDGNPTYLALKTAIDLLRQSPVDGKRILFYITDGGASCASLATPERPAYADSNGCNDWEDPSNVVTLLDEAHKAQSNPINTVIVGVPGADTTGANASSEPPYHVRNALSAYAWAGSPETVDPSCTGKAYSQAGADPQLSCHFDMTQSYSAAKLSEAIEAIRGKVLGCSFNLPAPDGGTVDRGKVNVEITPAGGAPLASKKRSSASDACASDGCWDYTPDGKVELIGKACDDVRGKQGAKVKIVVGCQTVVK